MSPLFNNPVSTWCLHLFQAEQASLRLQRVVGNLALSLNEEPNVQVDCFPGCWRLPPQQGWRVTHDVYALNRINTAQKLVVPNSRR